MKPWPQDGIGVEDIVYKYGQTGATSDRPTADLLTPHHYCYEQTVQKRDGDNTDLVVACYCGSIVCGDGYIDSPEQCDDSNTIETDGCSSTCLWNGLICPDGIPNISPTSTEECDDGNATDGDGCSSMCKNEPPPLVSPCILNNPIHVVTPLILPAGQNNGSYFVTLTPGDHRVAFNGSNNAFHIEGFNSHAKSGKNSLGNCVSIAGDSALIGELIQGIGNTFFVVGDLTEIEGVRGESNTFSVIGNRTWVQMMYGSSNVFNLTGNNNRIHEDQTNANNTFNINGSNNGIRLRSRYTPVMCPVPCPGNVYNISGINNDLDVAGRDFNVIINYSGPPGNNIEISFGGFSNNNHVTINGADYTISFAGGSNNFVNGVQIN